MSTFIGILGVPLVFFVFYSFFFLARDGVFPPFGENVLITGLVSLGIRLAANKNNGEVGEIVFGLGFGLLIALVYLAVHWRQRIAVEDTIESLLEKIKDEDTRTPLIRSAKALIEPDFIPGSLTNKLSVRKRCDVRKNFAKYIMHVHQLKVGEESFFPSNYLKCGSRVATIVLVFLSVGVFLYAYVYLPFIVGHTPLVRP